MSDDAWDRRSTRVWRREQGRLLAEWLRREVLPFSRFWAERLGNRWADSVEDLIDFPVAEEDHVAGAGGAGNPALLLLPTEAQYKRHAGRADLFAAAREVRYGGEQGRRIVLFRRYQPVHVHEAGVAKLLAIAYSRTDIDRLHLAGARLAEVAGLTSDDALVNAVPPGPSLSFWGIYHAALAARMTALHPRTEGRNPTAAVARALALLPATAIAVRVDEALELLTGLAQRGVAIPNVRTILAVGVPPSRRQRTAITEAARQLGAVGVRVQAVWAPESARALWAECRPPDGDPLEATYGLHTYPDLEILEVRDPADGRPVGHGEAGELLYTSLGWRGTALFRFATGAWTGGLATAAVCPACRRTVPRLAPDVAEAAWQPAVRVGGRHVRVDLRRAATVLSAERLAQVGVRDWSLRGDDGRLVLALDVDGGGEDRIVALAREVGGAVGVVPEVRLSREAAALRPQVGDAGPSEEAALR